LIDSIARRY